MKITCDGELDGSVLAAKTRENIQKPASELILKRQKQVGGALVTSQ